MVNFLAIIPARAGSKRIKNKNIIRIKGKYLFDYTLAAAKNCKEISRIIVTTNIKKILKKNTKRILYLSRPDYLCKDDTSTELVITHALNNAKSFLKGKNNTNIVLLQPTSPLRTKEDIKGAIKSFVKNKCDSLFSAYEQNLFIWQKKNKKVIPLNYSLKKRVRGQHKKNFYVENGAIFIFNAYLFKIYKNRLFKKIGVYLMSKKNSLEIDNKEDIKQLKLY